MSRATLRRLKALTIGVSLTVLSVTGAAASAQQAPPPGGPPPGMAARPIVPPKPARLADGHPNWTGFWVSAGGLLERNFGLGGTPPAPDGKPLPPPPAPFGDFPALKSPYKEQLGAFMMKVKQTGEVADPVAKCYPPGMPRMMSMVYGMELLQNPGQVSIMSEWQAAARRIWLDAKHPPEDELTPSYAGDSVGHWEGDTLVVDTIGIRGDVPLNYFGLQHSDKLHIVERLHSPAPGVLLDEFTIIDPDLFESGVWHHTEAYHYRPDLRLEEYVCLENNRNVGENGEATFDKKK